MRARVRRGERRGRLGQPSSLGVATVPWAVAAGTRGRGVPRDAAWHWDMHAPDTVTSVSEY